MGLSAPRPDVGVGERGRAVGIEGGGEKSVLLLERRADLGGVNSEAAVAVAATLRRKLVDG